MISGVLTCFFDFLTVETVTITVPMLFFVVMKEKAGRIGAWKKELGFMTAFCSVWGLSYGGMYFCKWLSAAKLMGSRVYSEVFNTAGYRIAHGGREGTLSRLYHAVAYNISCLCGTGEISVWVICICLLALIILLWKGRTFQRLLVCLGMIPYLRYLVLSGHSMEHYFYIQGTDDNNHVSWNDCLAQRKNGFEREETRMRKKENVLAVYYWHWQYGLPDCRYRIWM